MVIHSGELPFQRGDTLKGTDADGNLINSDKVGLMYWMSDVKLSGNQRGQKALRSNTPVLGMVCRNVSGIALLGKRLGQRERDATNIFDFSGHVDGYANTLRGTGLIAIDEHLPSAGVADDDLFWGILYGHAILLTPNAGAEFPEDIAAHARLICATGAGTTTSLAGRIGSVTLSTATQALETALIGWALTARTSNNTGSEVMVKMTLGFRE